MVAKSHSKLTPAEKKDLLEHADQLDKMIKDLPIKPEKVFWKTLTKLEEYAARELSAPAALYLMRAVFKTPRIRKLITEKSIFGNEQVTGKFMNRKSYEEVSCKISEYLYDSDEGAAVLEIYHQRHPELCQR